jgi:23S rRNA pseudouridine2605 synthase
METLIEEGRIEVNGTPAILGQRVSARDRIFIDGRPVRFQAATENPQVIMYHKPAGELVTANDPEGRPTVFDKLPRLKSGKWIAIGRLDFNTSGLLLLTDSGDLANRLMHPRHGIEREYAVRIVGELSREQERTLKTGVQLDDGPAKFDELRFKGGEGSNRWYEVTLREGRNREVRRMFEALGLTVSRLIRIRFGSLELPPRLSLGRWLPVDERDVDALIKASSGT